MRIVSVKVRKSHTDWHKSDTVNMEEGGAVSATDVGLEYNIKKELGPGGDIGSPYRINISTYHKPAPKKNSKI